MAKCPPQATKENQLHVLGWNLDEKREGPKNSTSLPTSPGLKEKRGRTKCSPPKKGRFKLNIDGAC